MENKKKIILIILIIAIISILGFLYIKYNKEKKEMEVNNQKLMQENLERFADYMISIRIISFDQFNQNFTIDNITDQMVLTYLYSAYKNYFINEKEISKDEINNYLNHVFGDKVKLTINDFGYSNNISDYCVKYDKNKKIYQYNDNCLNDFSFASINCLVDTYVENDIYYALVKHYYFTDGAVYNTYQDMLNKNQAIHNYQLDDLVKTQLLISENVNNYPSDIRKYSFVPNGNEFTFKSYEVINK